MIAAVAVMVLLWLLVVLSRNDIRVWWWGYRLRQCSALTDRVHYMQLLVGMGARCLPVAEDLLADEDAALRSFGVALLHPLAGEESFALLGRACHDPDAEVRQSAIIGLSLRAGVQTVPLLCELTDHVEVATAMLATSRLGMLRSPAALDALRGLACGHTQAGVRAQAIETLAEWGGDEVVDTLITCLADEVVFEGLTVSQRGAADALLHAAPHLVEENSIEEIVGAGCSNGARAARGLRALTGQNFGYLEAPPGERTASLEAWRRWRRSSFTDR